MTSPEDLTTQFNSYFFDSLLENIARVCPHSKISLYRDDLRKHIRSKQTLVIDFFITSVLPFKEKIDAGDESFFMEKTYGEEEGGTSSSMSKAIEFKQIWTKLSAGNKAIVIQTMQILCYFALEYYKVKFT
jgi:hypothetical protein